MWICTIESAKQETDKYTIESSINMSYGLINKKYFLKLILKV